MEKIIINQKYIIYKYFDVLIGKEMCLLDNYYCYIDGEYIKFINWTGINRKDIINFEKNFSIQQNLSHCNENYMQTM